ncbi:GNAT family N-acetyltransferase [Bacillus subtilis]|uniref:GNAT family N-acetyltransferase n=1 Tax=Bacillus stercoris TaxID=2054641 RepID=UPI001BA290EB|nr:GNAT family N-acetyltransferase [Bacillus subtilis]MEC1264378.1 GNAT family N-acetyltransferase [Bacillus subtilis]CAF1779662.1 Putative ribosomal N-acetyltransferase YdaF [Bacillus subtilis]CAI6241227.1 GNAT family N-acetyltransferase [Bacillus subtilis]
MNVTLRELTGELIRVVPMDKSHIQGLYEAAKDENIWAHLPKTITTLHDMEAFVEEALQTKECGTEFPFVIIHRESGKIVGTTRFLYMSSASRSLEIGWTWFHPSVWGTSVNSECKYLLLQYCFERLNTIRVQFKTDERNIRSQKAIERLGAVKEGILRNQMIRKDGTFRNSVFYSLIDRDWPSVKLHLERRLQLPEKETK